MGIDSFSNDIIQDFKVGPLQDYYKKSLNEWLEFVENEHDQDIKKNDPCCFADKMDPVKKEMVRSYLARRLG